MDPIESDGNLLRVVLVGGYSPNAAYLHGGVQAAVAYLVKGLVRIDDLDIHVLTFRPSSWVGPNCYNQDGVCVHLLPPPPRFERLHRYRTYQSIFNHALEKIKPDIVHAQEAAADAFVAINSGFPTIVTAHGIRREDVKYVRSWGRRLRFYWDSVLTERPVMRKVKYLIAISQYITAYFSQLLRPDINKYYISNAVDERYFNIPNVPSEPVVLFAGKVTPLKRVLDLVLVFERVVCQIPAAQLRIAGDCHTEAAYASSIQKYIQQAGLEKNVHLLGELDQETILREFACCSLLALPSSQENSPMVIAQAMAAAKAVVATKVGGIEEMLGSDRKRGVLVPVGGVDKLAETILNLLQDAHKREEIGQAGRRYALENFHPASVAMRTAEVYREVVSRETAAHG